MHSGDHLTSGGLDSTTCLATARATITRRCIRLTFDYGRATIRTPRCGHRRGIGFGCKEHRLITIDLRQFGKSALTDDIAVPRIGRIQNVG